MKKKLGKKERESSKTKTKREKKSETAETLIRMLVSLEKGSSLIRSPASQLARRRAANLEGGASVVELAGARRYFATAQKKRKKRKREREKDDICQISCKVQNVS